jgi:hypothetical protein
MKNKKNKKQMVDEHLLYVYKNTTPLQRLVWLKKQIDFCKKIKSINKANI